MAIFSPVVHPEAHLATIDLAVLQAPIFDSLLLDPFAMLDDELRPAEVGIGRCDVVQTLMIALMAVVLDERFDLLVKVAGHIAWTVVYSP